MNKLLMLGLLGLMSCEFSVKKVNNKFEVGDCIWFYNEGTFKVLERGQYSYKILSKTGLNRGNVYLLPNKALENAIQVDCFEEVKDEH
jgi:hypothetical protein